MGEIALIAVQFFLTKFVHLSIPLIGGYRWNTDGLLTLATHKRTIGRSRSSTQSHQVLSSKELLFWILIAESIIDESDVICVVVKNDSIQETRFHFSFCKRHSRLSDGPHQGS